ncbi:MAG: condensation domain-containing protein [Azospirillaceae bacterium]|nr:condensation domain-containing protein [Azospirillaceae bacterium]
MSANNRQWVRTVVADILAEDPAALADTENLFEAGLDSIGLLRLVNRWRRDGIQVSFAELAQDPTLTAWTALVDRERAGPGGGTPAVTETPAAAPADSGSAPLGIMQHAYWVGRSPGQRLGGVAAHLYAEFDRPSTGGGPAIDPNALRSALERLIKRHETLRTRVTPDGRQEVLATLAPPLAVHDLQDRSAAEVWSHLAKVRAAFSHQMLDVEEGQVFAVALSLLPDGATRLHVDVDMIAADAVSYRLLLADLVALYIAPAKGLPPLGLTYRQHLATTETGKADRARPAAEAWRDRLATLPGAPILPELVQATEEFPQPAVARRHVWLSPERKHMLTDIARRKGVTVAMAVATVLAEVVGHWSATDHFLLNVPMFDRPANHPDIDRVVGDFSSSVMLEVDLRQSLAFVDRVRALQQRMHADAAHAAHTGLDVLRDLSRQRGETVLAPVVFTSALGLGELFAPAVTEIIGRPVWVVSQGPQVLLDAQVTEFDGGLLVNWDTREEALVPGVVDAMFAVFQTALQRLIDQPETWNQPLALSDQNPRRTHEGHLVRVVDPFEQSRPAHVPGRLRVMGEDVLGDQPGAIRWARADGDGRVTVLGRDHDRVEVNGVPVFPAEVEEAVRSAPQIRDAAVVRITDTQGDGLVAAVVFAAPTGEETAGKAFRAYLARRIPAHLLPTRVIVLNELPRDAAGVIEAEILRQASLAQAEPAGGVAPRTDLERVIAGVWAEVLGLEQVGVNEEFIALGGDSLLAARVVARLQEELDTHAITLRALFRSPTIAELAEQLRRDDDPGRLDEVAAIILEIRAMSDEDVAAQLGEAPVLRQEAVA